METNAYHARQDGVFCDACHACLGQLGGHAPLSHGSPISVDLADWRNPSNPQPKMHHFCNEACLSAHLAVRQQEKENHAHATKETEEAKASHQHKIMCDGCRACIAENEGESDMSPPVLPHKAVAVHLPDEDGQKRLHHFCSESCMAEHLEKREKMKKEAMASLDQVQLKVEKSTPFWEVNMFSANGMTPKEKREHHHNNKPYGDVEYADPKNHKYPVNTPEHVRAALSYINHPKNAGEYSSSELAAIKAKIHAAAKKFGIKVSEAK